MIVKRTKNNYKNIIDFKPKTNFLIDFQSTVQAAGGGIASDTVINVKKRPQTIMKMIRNKLRKEEVIVGKEEESEEREGGREKRNAQFCT